MVLLFGASQSTEAYLNEQDARLPTATVPHPVCIYMGCFPLPSKLPTSQEIENHCSCLLLSPPMDEACNKALCSEAACVWQGEDRHDAASCTSPSGASSGSSSCLLASDLGDGSSCSPPDDHSSGSSSESSSTLQLDSEAEGPLYELSSLLAQLPARRGLSKYYQGKSQSFTSISYATSLQDLGKEVTYSKRMKTCKSYTAGLGMNQRSNHLPRTCNKMIAKRPSKSSFACQMSRASSTNLLYSSANLAAQQNKEDVQMHLNS